jgi:hypothetical protein
VTVEWAERPECRQRDWAQIHFISMASPNKNAVRANEIVRERECRIRAPRIRAADFIVVLVWRHFEGTPHASPQRGRTALKSGCPGTHAPKLASACFRDLKLQFSPRNRNRFVDSGCLRSVQTTGKSGVSWLFCETGSAARTVGVRDEETRKAVANGLCPFEGK